MIGVGAPWILGFAVLGALATVALHFLSVRRPPVLLLPTMRFLPDRPVRAVSRNARPSDLLLLLMRVAALLLIGVALAGVTWKGTGVKHGRIVVVQRGVHEDRATLQSVVGQALRGGFAGDTATRIVVVDSSARMLSVAESQAFKPESLSVPNPARVGTAAISPTLSAALLASVRAAAALVAEERTVDAVELTIAAPLTRSLLDAATPAARAMWNGHVRLLDTHATATEQGTGTPDSVLPPRTIAFAGEKPNEAVSSAFAVRGWLANANATGASPVVASQSITVEWPASGAPAGWSRSAPDTIGALIAKGSALVFPFVRSAQIPDEIRNQGRAIAWWSDGRVAALEVPTASGCTRHVGVGIPSSSDVLNGQGARPLLLALSAPCGGDFGNEPSLAAEAVRALEGSGAAAPASAFRSSTVVRTPWAAALLLVAIALLVAEWWARDKEEAAIRSVNDELNDMRRVA